MKLKIDVADEIRDEIVIQTIEEWAQINANEIIPLLEELREVGLRQYKVKDLNDSAITLDALITVLKYCTAGTQVDYYEEILAEYSEAIFSE